MYVCIISLGGNNFSGEKVRETFLSQELIFAGILEKKNQTAKSAKTNNRKIFVPHSNLASSTIPSSGADLDREVPQRGGCTPD